MTHYLWIKSQICAVKHQNAARARQFNMRHAVYWMVYTSSTMTDVVARWEGWN